VPLVLGVIQLGEPVRDFTACDVELEPVGEVGIFVIAAGERGNLDRIVKNISRSNSCVSMVFSNNVSCNAPTPSSGR